MSFSLLPKVIAREITQLTPEFLADRGVELLMMDFDNTIVPYVCNEPTEKVKKWLCTMQASSISLCVVSNSRKDRVREFCREYGLDCITHARKPFSRGIVQCLKKYGLDPCRCALVGDQIYTDTLGANCAGVQSILVNAICNHNILLKGRHVLEMPWIFMARNRRMKCSNPEII